MAPFLRFELQLNLCDKGCEVWLLLKCSIYRQEQTKHVLKNQLLVYPQMLSNYLLWLEVKFTLIYAWNYIVYDTSLRRSTQVQIHIQHKDKKNVKWKFSESCKKKVKHYLFIPTKAHKKLKIYKIETSQPWPHSWQ